MTHERPLLPAQAYPIDARLADMEKFIATMAASGLLERTQGFRVAETYRVPLSAVRATKARFRNELSFSGEGK